MKNFFDRDDERKTIDATIKQMNLNQSAMIWIEGASGVGKSCLLKYSLKKFTCTVFKYYGYKNVYKCDKQDLGQEFSFISAILSTLQNINPKKFQEKLYNYFNNNNYIHVFDALETIIPVIPGFQWSKDLFDKFNSQTQETRKYIIDKTLKSTMILCFSEIILELLQYHFKESNIVFCIDDMVWMDFSSLETLETILSKSRINPKYSTKISLFITTRNRNELEYSDYKNYDKIESDFFNELFVLKCCVMLSNFKQPILREIIYTEKRFGLYKYAEAIFHVTAGNPQEIIQTLKFDDSEIIRRIDDNSLKNKTLKEDGSYFTHELIESLCIKNEYALLIMSVASIVEKYLKPQLLISICSAYFKKVLKSNFDYGKYEAAMALLKSNDFIIEEEFVCVKHDSIKLSICEYINETGDFTITGKVISDFFINDAISKDECYFARVKIALNILKTIDPYSCFKVFMQLTKEDKRHFSHDNINIIALCITRCFNSISDDEINNIVVPDILQTLVSTAKYHVANRLCELLMIKFDYLSHNNKKVYLTCFVKILIDLGLIQETGNNNPCALEIANKLISYSKNENDLLSAYLLKMSAHEHISEFQEIKELYNKSYKIVKRGKNLDSVSLSKFYRNKGLVTFHTNLEKDYLKAYQYATCIDNYDLRNIMQGTCQNNLGLTYFYNGDIPKALACFNEAYRFLNYAGYDLLRVINNISACYFMMSDYDNSYKYITIAKSLPLKGVFEEVCVDVNLALNMYKCGQKSEAKKRLDAVIEEYNSKRIKTDTAAYSAAMVNRGYIFLDESDYINAYKMFKSSTCHTYKNANDKEQRKRRNLCDICLYNENILSDISNNCIDLSESTNNLFNRPYSLILLAFYII